MTLDAKWSELLRIWRSEDEFLSITQMGELINYLAELERLTAPVPLIYATQETTFWGTYKTGDEVAQGGNIGAWYENATFWKKRCEAAEKTGIQFVDGDPRKFEYRNIRAEKAEAENATLRTEAVS